MLSGDNMEKYYERLIDRSVERDLRSMGALLIEGPKWSGKSTTASRHAKTTVQLQNPLVFKRYQVLASTSMGELLEGEKPILFDEWQKIPELWDFIRLAVDESVRKGEYILTGSAKPIRVDDRHTGTGRFARLTMRTMSLWESLESNGQVSLSELFANPEYKINTESALSVKELAYLVCRGGWPGTLGLDREVALDVVKHYFSGLVNADIVDVDGIKRDAAKARSLLRSYARNISSFATYSTMLSDINSQDKIMSDETFYSYVRAFEKLFVIENIKAWSPRLRSKTTIRSSEKKQFVDPSVAAAALGIHPHDLMNDVETFGFFFESLCERDLRVYVESLGGTLSHYVDNSGLEIDSVLHLPNGDWGAVEIKLGGNEIEEAAANLIKLNNNIAEEEKKAKFLMVLTGYPYGYKRPDGVYVVPLGCLRP